ncbi:hypothetical protein D3C76_1408880 [compost metagenome]
MSITAELNSTSTPNAASTSMIARQPKCAPTKPPSAGAITGARPSMVISKAKICAARAPSATSRTMLMITTRVRALPRPWMKRASSRLLRSGAAAAARELRTNTSKPASNGRRRPRVSTSGPNSSCPAPMARRNTVRVNCTPA